MKKSIILVIFALTLSACATVREKKSEYIKNHANDYLKSSVIAALRVPEGLSLPKEENVLYPLPQSLPEPGSVVPPPLEPPGFRDNLRGVDHG